MATFGELLEMAMDAETWVKGVERTGELIKLFPYQMAEEARDGAWEHHWECSMRKDSGTETDEQRMERKYTKEIWEQTYARMAWLDYQEQPKHPWERKE